MQKNIMAKSKEIQWLEEEAYQMKLNSKPNLFKELMKNGTTSESLRRQYKPSFSESDANSLTKAVESLFIVCGGWAWRVNTMGVYDKKLKKYRPSGSSKGFSDLVGMINSNVFFIEIKYGKDQQSDDQKKFERQVKKAGGTYLIVRNFKQIHDIIKPIAELIHRFDLIPGGEE